MASIPQSTGLRSALGLLDIANSDFDPFVFRGLLLVKMRTSEQGAFKAQLEACGVSKEQCEQWLEANSAQVKENTMSVWAYWSVLHEADSKAADNLRRRMHTRGLRDTLNSIVRLQQRSHAAIMQRIDSVAEKWPAWDWGIENATPEWWSEATLKALVTLAKAQPDHIVALAEVRKHIEARVQNRTRGFNKPNVVQPID